MNMEKNRRILVIDDNQAIHKDFRKILASPAESTALDAAEARLLGTALAAAPKGIDVFEVESAYQ
jgi:two-component system, NtrC family, sensor kinase